MNVCSSCGGGETHLKAVVESGETGLLETMGSCEDMEGRDDGSATVMGETLTTLVHFNLHLWKVIAVSISL